MNWNIVWQIALFAGIGYILLGLFRSSGSGAGGGCCGGHGGHDHGGHAHGQVHHDQPMGRAESGAHGKYYCPMHPEITSDDPEATCPKCGGMKLQPRPARKAMA